MDMKKTANISLRISEEIKEKAEQILTKLGLPRSVAIDMFYRQIIINNGLPFETTLNSQPLVLENMTKREFDDVMTKGIKEAQSGNTQDIDTVFEDLLRGI